MNIVMFGLTIPSSWGNGHATTYRGLVKALAQRGHTVTFLERDVPWYRDNRDEPESPHAAVILYDSLEDARRFAPLVAEADLVIVGSYVPEGATLGGWITSAARGVTAFYDIDTPVTLAGLEAGGVDYLTRALIPAYDLYLSFTGGPTLRRLEDEYGSPCARALYCAVDSDLHQAEPQPERWALGYLGTYSDDRQPTLERLLLEPARAEPDLRFIVAGAQYPASIAWPANVEHVQHLPPRDHAGFYCAQRFTLNVTRADMIAAGWSPSVRLFEAAACGAPIVSDRWAGLDTIFAPGTEILIAGTTADMLAILRDMPEERRRAVAEAARRRVLRSHTARNRAAELEAHVGDALAARRTRKDQRAYA